MKQFDLPIFESSGMLATIAPGFETVDAPKFVATWYVDKCKSWREVCRMAWQMRRVRNMTYTMFAAYGGFTRQHVGDWFNPDDKPTRRSMPVDCVHTAESILGVRILSQWIAKQSRLTILEEMQAERALAYA